MSNCMSELLWYSLESNWSTQGALEAFEAGLTEGSPTSPLPCLFEDLFQVPVGILTMVIKSIIY